MMVFWVAAASAGQCASICSLLQTDNHTDASSLNFLQVRCSSSCQTNSVKALKAQKVRHFQTGLLDLENFQLLIHQGRPSVHRNSGLVLKLSKENYSLLGLVAVVV